MPAGLMRNYNLEVAGFQFIGHYWAIFAARPKASFKEKLA